MRTIRNLYIFVSLLTLMILRPFAPGQWMGSVTVAGLLITWLDTIHQVWINNRDIIAIDKKKKYACLLSIMALVGLVLLVLILVNLIVGLEWLNYPIVLDEITLLSILTCLFQKTIIHWSNKLINN